MDFFGQEGLKAQQNAGGVDLNSYLNFKPTTLSGQQWQPSQSMQKPLTPQQILSSVNKNPISLNNSLGQMLDFNGLDLPSVNTSLTSTQTPSVEKSTLWPKGQIDLQGAFNAINQTVASPSSDPFADFKQKEGDFRSFKVSNMNQNLTRYEKSGDDVTKIPFNPFNNNEKLYHDRMSNLQDMRRAFSGFMMTAGLGFVDSIGMGRMIDTDSANVFDTANKLGASSKEGTVGFLSNMIVSAGYTGGIIAEIGLEGLAMSSLEAAAGLTAPITAGASAGLGAAAGGLMAADIARKAKQLKNTISELSNPSVWKSFKNSAFKAINPLDDIQTFNKAIKPGGMFEGAKNWQKGIGYGTAAWRGFNKIKFAYEESALEAGTTFNESKQKAIEFYKQNHNGNMPDKAEMDKIEDYAKEASYKTFSANMPLIYLSNAFVFDDLLRPTKFNISAGKGVARASRNRIAQFKENGEWQVMKLSNNYWDRAKELWAHKGLAASMAANSAKRYVAENTIEGAQEVLQDWFQNSSQQMFMEKYNPSEERGSYYNYLLSNAGSMLSAQSGESFLSGFLMQALISPISRVSSYMSTGFQNKETLRNSLIAKAVTKPIDLVKNVSERVAHRNEEGGYQAWKAKQVANEEADYEKRKSEGKLTADEQIDQDVETLKEFYKDPMKYANPLLLNMAEQGKLHEYMDRCQKEGDKMGFIDGYNQAKFSAIRTALQYGSFDNIIEALDDFKAKTSPEDFEKEHKGITYEQYIGEIDKTKEYAKSIQSKWDAVNEQFANPIKVDEKLKETDKDTYDEQFGNWYSYEQAKWDIVFQQKNVEDCLNRIESIGNNLNTTANLVNTPYNSIKPLLSESDIFRERTLVNGELAPFKDIKKETMEQEVLTQIRNNEEKLAQLKKLEELLNEAKVSRNEGVSYSKFNELQNEVKKYLQRETKEYGDRMPSDNDIANTTANIVDAWALSDRANISMAHVNVLMNPSGLEARAASYKHMFDLASKAKDKEIKESLQKFRDKMDATEILKELHSIGVFFDYDKYEALKKDGKVPDLYEFTTDLNGIEKANELDYKSEKYKKAVDIIVKYFPKAHGMKIFNNAKNLLGRTRQEVNDERTSADIANDYGIDLYNPDKEYTASEILDKLIGNKYTNSHERALAAALIRDVKPEDKIKFTMNQDRPLTYDRGTNTITIDIRYFGNEYIGTSMIFEDGLLRAEVLRKSDKALSTDIKFKNQISDLLKESKDALLENNKLKDYVEFEEFSNEAQFIAAALTNDNVRNYLNSIETKGKYDEIGTEKPKNLWERFLQILRNLFKSDFKQNSVLNGLMDVVNKKFDFTKPSSSSSSIEDDKYDEYPTIEEIKADSELKDNLVKDFINSISKSGSVEFNNILAESIGTGKDIDDLRNISNTLDSISKEMKKSGSMILTSGPEYDMLDKFLSEQFNKETQSDGTIKFTPTTDGIAEIDAAKADIDNIIASSETTKYSSMTNDEIIDIPEFSRYYYDPSFSSKEKIISDWKTKNGWKPTRDLVTRKFEVKQVLMEFMGGSITLNDSCKELKNDLSATTHEQRKEYLKNNTKIEEKDISSLTENESAGLYLMAKNKVLSSNSLSIIKKTISDIESILKSISPSRTVTLSSDAESIRKDISNLSASSLAKSQLDDIKSKIDSSTAINDSERVILKDELEKAEVSIKKYLKAKDEYAVGEEIILNKTTGSKYVIVGFDDNTRMININNSPYITSGSSSTSLSITADDLFKTSSKKAEIKGELTEKEIILAADSDTEESTLNYYEANDALKSDLSEGMKLLNSLSWEETKAPMGIGKSYIDVWTDKSHNYIYIDFSSIDKAKLKDTIKELVNQNAIEFDKKYPIDEDAFWNNIEPRDVFCLSPFQIDKKLPMAVTIIKEPIC